MTLLGLLAIALCLRITISDLYARRVPNAWLLATSALAVLLLVTGQFNAPRLPWLPHVAGAALGLMALLPFYALRWMGAGDVKFFCVLGLMLGWQALLPIWIAASLAAGAHAALVLASRRLRWMLPLGLQAQVSRANAHWHSHPALRGMQSARQGRRGIPYAAYLALAAIGWILFSTYGGLA
ncbi:prepilin peptidase [Stenotrophomonas maltophilia]|uniref:A24 family peptidase n=1 Tax=Stenotrophomonas sp. RAC2 TaxID=3064902 RepID=UPI0018D4C06E|nr:A24 family peptidase [Stenotrophomonas sp. RAC2]MBH1432045.1 prepilin peptidase [Stenotrophomonas maltophilia]MDV9040360.1 A24 family peptidase [Stenotrophomonas sp. RAC2]